MTDPNDEQAPDQGQHQFGTTNSWLVDELYREYLADPEAVAPSWRDFFSDYTPAYEAPAARPVPAATMTQIPPAPAPPSKPPGNGRTETAPAKAAPAPKGDGASGEAGGVPPDAKQLRGVALALAENMDASRTVPTATSIRVVPAKLLEVNRRIVNNQLRRTRGGKASFTHFIGWAIVRAMQRMPVMATSYVEVEGKSYSRRAEHINLGLAVDIERKDGSRTLLVPNIKAVDTLDFAGFLHSYEEVIRRIRANKLDPEMFAGTTATLTNPGTVGTVGSVPRLMPGQSVIVGVGAIDYPAEWQGADPRTIAQMAVGKVATITSTYDHRVIQGAESGLFLRYIHELLAGEHDFYDEIFTSLHIPYVPVRWHRDEHIASAPAGSAAHADKQVAVGRLVNAYRVRGHLIANLNPLQHAFTDIHEELDPATYGLTIWDLDREFATGGLGGRGDGPSASGPSRYPPRMQLQDILGVVRDAYCRTVGVEYMHISEREEKRWIQEQVEGEATSLPTAEQRHILGQLNNAEAFERFLHTKYIGHKRFSLEGAESTIPMLDALLSEAADAGLAEAVIGMAHRGRLNVLANILAKGYDKIFREFEGDMDPDTVQGSGDVKYHLGARGEHRSPAGNEIALTLSANPSHLEAVDPVVEGMARAKLDVMLGGEIDGSAPVLPVLVHGDAAFAGQGVVAETLALSQLHGYRTGGSIHLVINNQVGFTTGPQQARSSTYATDVAKMVQAPILHVNGDDPEACVRVMRLAFAYRQRFAKDVVVDMVCYRRWGHNEGDDPSYTQPLMYAAIEQRRNVRKLYTEELVNRGDLTVEEAEEALEAFRSQLESSLKETRESRPPKTQAQRPDHGDGLLPHVETGVDRATLTKILDAITTAPEGFTIHPKLAKQLEKRRTQLDGDAVDWATGEAFAFGSLLLEGFPVRLAGQDSRRGTFSQRHSVLIDYTNGGEHCPLNVIGGSAPFMVYDSPLSEFACMGFEYGYSVVRKDALVAWEAQFGDFVNGAQVIIDQFLVAAEDKWRQTSGLVLLLPHGYEGQGPEHSSARKERFLTQAAENNIQIVEPSTSAQYFHLLRRQMVADVRRPLVVFTPKGLLRARPAMSPAAAFESGSFEEVLVEDGGPQPDEVRRVLLCSGRVAFDLITARDKASAPVAVVRVEQVYPWPAGEIRAAIDRYPNAQEVFWVQDEPENMGGWPFVHGRLHRLLRDTHTLRHVSRVESGSPATGTAKVHEQEQAELLDTALAGLNGSDDHDQVAPSQQVDA